LYGFLAPAVNKNGSAQSVQGAAQKTSFGRYFQRQLLGGRREQRDDLGPLNRQGLDAARLTEAGC
jgi:hypothetical protein